MGKPILKEDTLANAVAREAADNKIHDANNLEYVLDRAYQANMNKKKREARGQEPSGFINVLVTGGAGIGKTARVKSWCKSKGLRFIAEDVKGMDISDIGGAISPDRETGTKAIKLGTTQFDDLDFTSDEEGNVTDKYSVLFLDEFNRGDAQIRGSLLTLINNHTVPDPNAPGHERYLSGMLFTVVAINPGGGDYNTDVLDAAERSRFLIVNMRASNKDSLDFYIKQYKGDLAVEDDPEEIAAIKGRLNLATTLLKSGQFEFDSEQEEAIAQENQTNILNPRTLTQCLDMSDGTKKDFLMWWNSACNPAKRGIMETILSNYKDVENKANSVFNKKPEEDASIFKKKEETPLDKFNKYKKNAGF